METIYERIKSRKIIAIIRGAEKSKILLTGKALYDGGIRMIEVTFNQKEPPIKTATMIKALCCEFGNEIHIGAGTVMTKDQLETAAEAGAKYIISPNIDLEIIKLTKKRGLISIPGAFTPSEIAAAYNEGADFVKVFPAGCFGTEYIKAIRAPINHVPLLAVGGIDENNMIDFLKVGICGFGIGSNIVKEKYIEEGSFDKITELAKKFVNVIEAY